MRLCGLRVQAEGHPCQSSLAFGADEAGSVKEKSKELGPPFSFSFSSCFLPVKVLVLQVDSFLSYEHVAVGAPNLGLLLPRPKKRREASGFQKK
jgi:hypothetical protein